jgi:hypothetical protein
VTLSGTYECSFTPPAIGTETQDFSATLVLERDEWTGQGSFTYGNHLIDDVPVKLEED